MTGIEAAFFGALNGSLHGDRPPIAPDDDGPLRDPAVDRAFVKLTADLEAADNDLAKMRAIRDCAELLEPLADEEAIRDLSEMGHACGISEDNIEAMKGIIEQGFEIARQERGRTKSNGHAGIVQGQDDARESPNQGNQAVAIVPTPYRYRPASEIPPREWLYGRHYIRGAVTSTIAPGGYTKSNRSLTECIAMVTGRNLLGEAPAQRVRAWYWNGEDTRIEIERLLR
jgi:hypothetical protein